MQIYDWRPENNSKRGGKTDEPESTTTTCFRCGLMEAWSLLSGWRKEKCYGKFSKKEAFVWGLLLFRESAMPNCVKPGEVALFLTLSLLFSSFDILNRKYGEYGVFLFLAMNIDPSENMMFDCKLGDLDFEAFHDLSIICILQFVLMKCITAPNVTLFSRSTRISRRPGALSRSPMVASLDSQKCHWTLPLHCHHPKFQIQNNNKNQQNKSGR